MKCLQEDLVPKSVKLHFHAKTAKEINIIHRCEKQLLNARIGESISKLEILQEKRQILTDNLSSKLNNDHFTQVQGFINKASESEFTKVRSRQQSKLDNIRQDFYKHPPPYKKDNIKFHVPDDVKRRWVINKSSKSLTRDEISVLSRGPKFSVTQDRIPVEDIIPMVESGLLGIPDSDADSVRNDIVKAIKQSKVPDSNISQGERKALTRLKKDRSIMILPADKGTALVVIDTKEYEAKCLNLLADKDTYEELKHDPTVSLQRQLIDKLKGFKNKGNLSEQKYQKMRPSGNRSPAPKFYGLPKIHKDGTPFRGIVSSCASLSHNTAKELTRILQPLIGSNGHNVTSTKDFVDRMDTRQLDDGEIQVSFDVSNLFGNINIDKALKATRKRLENDPTLEDRTDLTVDQIIELLEFCLRNTYFTFHGKFYKQKFGAAMGSPVSPVIANIFMEDFESNAIETAPTPPKCWDRYVDDTYTIVKKDKVNELHSPVSSSPKNLSQQMAQFLSLIQSAPPNLMVPYTPQSIGNPLIPTFTSSGIPTTPSVRNYP